MIQPLTLTVSPRKILALVISLCVGWLSFISVQSINDHADIAALYEKHTSDERQDTELREIRRTLQDMTVLFFQLESPEEELLPPLENFNAAQMVIEDLVTSSKRKGLVR